MKNVTCINDLFPLVESGAITATKAAQVVIDRGWTYGIKYFSPQHKSELPYWDIFRAYNEIIDAQKPAPVKTMPKIETKLCSCGCTVPRVMVMSASMGTSCPDCYDRMSD